MFFPTGKTGKSTFGRRPIYQAASAAEASALIRSECHKILNELAGYQYDPEAYKRRVRDREGWSEALADEDDD